MREKATQSRSTDEIRWCVAPEFGGVSEVSDFANYVPVRVISSGRERVEEMEIRRGNGAEPLRVVVKTFPRQSVAKRFFAKRTGTKAQRAFLAAKILRERGVGTPPPVALAERISPRGEVLESRLVTAFVPGLTDLRRELHRLISGEGIADPATELSALLQTVADACRAFHDCGIVHRDLGNQNIGLKKTAAGTWEVVFLDLDRVRIFPAGTLTWTQRGGDLARIFLPSELRWFFCHMYSGEVARRGTAFRKGVESELRAWNFHSKTRFLRHPIQAFRRHRMMLRTGGYDETPLEGIGVWIWDEKTAQAVIAHDKKASRQFRPFSNIFRSLKEFLLRGSDVRKNYRSAQARSFAEPVELAGTLGMTLEASAEQAWAPQLRLLDELETAARARLPILLRAYFHKGEAQWAFAVEKARELRARGNAVAFALVQSRAALREPKAWARMVNFIVSETHAFADFYEIGHATNRSKWGIWDFRDYAKLLAPALAAKRAFPQIRLTGPACIDFDLHNLPGILSVVPAGTFSALSHHLYVDRRGAPENFQGKFDLARKCALHRAIARAFGFSEEKIIVSEVNWPLLGTGTFSPCGAFFCEPGGPFSSPPSVSEEDYAKFALRYILLALGSGHVSRIYWWRLVHRGFGLADDSDPANPRPMPAFFALKNLLAQLAGARFERRLSSADGVPAGTFATEFSRADGSRFRATWTRDAFPQFEFLKQKKS